MALHTREPAPVSWQGAGASGEVTVASTSDLAERPVCRSFRDRLTLGETTTEVHDVACWGEMGWYYVAPGLVRPVLTPAYLAGERVYTVERRTRLATLARRTGAALADLRRLNPNLPDRLEAGTAVLLP